MNYTYLQLQTAVGLLNGVGPVRGRELITQLSSLEELFFDTPKNLAIKTSYPEVFFQQMNRKEALDSAEKAVEFHAQKGITSIFYSDPAFPHRLSECPDAPMQLYIKGDISLNDPHFISVVGTRAATKYGREVCEQLVRSLVDKNIVVVSGLAYGIDAWTHHYCIEYGVPTIAVLGHGLDRIYPARHKQLAGSILEQGALLTEFIPGTNPDRENFPKRNRIVAGLCDATIVVESKSKGGSLITAELANDYNRDVFAVPGSIYAETSVGCNELIQNNQAILLNEPTSLPTIMGWESTRKKPVVQRKVFTHLSELQQRIVCVIQQYSEIQIDLLSIKAGLSVSKLNAELFELEIEGVVRGMPGNKYRVL